MDQKFYITGTRRFKMAEGTDALEYAESNMPSVVRPELDGWYVALLSRTPRQIGQLPFRLTETEKLKVAA